VGIECQVSSINIDPVVNADKVPIAGETVRGSEFHLHPGGKGAKQAVAVGRLGHPVQLIGKLGKDTFGVERPQQRRFPLRARVRSGRWQAVVEQLLGAHQ
jgi:hypothetical protein